MTASSADSAGSAPATPSPSAPAPTPATAPSSVPIHPGLLTVVEKGSAPGRSETR
jgi:hypothetical protein